MRGKYLTRLCRHSGRCRVPQNAAMNPIFLKQSASFGSKARGNYMKTLFFTGMYVRERMFAMSARAEPDSSAKVETLQYAADGKEHPAVVAFRNDSLAFGFSAGGLMFPYYIGVISGLSELGIIQPSKTPLAGASAGSLIAACYHSGVSPSAIMEANLELASMLRKRGVYRQLGPVLQEILQKHLPEDAHERCNGSTFVAVTNVSPYVSSALISEFHCKQDLINALLTSCHIPIYFTGSLLTNFRGRPALDGGITNFLPVPPQAEYTARVCCFPSQNFSLGNVHVSPDCFDDAWANVTLPQLLTWALTPASDEVMQQMYDKGRADGDAWARLTGVGEAAAPDSDDWYRYSQLNHATHVAPPMMSVDDR